jgi:hypothetical protein
MRRRIVLCGVVCGLLLALGCAKPKVWVPPRIDLHQYGTLGLVEFRSQGQHGQMATQRFLSAVHGAQGGVPVLELGPMRDVLQSVGQEQMGPDAARAIGERYGVDVLVVGDLDIEPPRPDFSIESLTEASASAAILGRLNARILEARSGATIWSDEASGKRTIARLDLSAGQQPWFGAVDPDGEDAALVTWLVDRVTGDFRGRWARP